MTGGTALPADISQPPAPGPPQPGDQDQPGSSDQQSTQEPASRLPGLPRLYFPDLEDQPPAPTGEAERPGQRDPSAAQPHGQPHLPASAPYGGTEQPSGGPSAPYGGSGRPSGGADQQQGLTSRSSDEPRGRIFQRRPAQRPTRQRPTRQRPTRQRPTRQRPTRQPERELRHRAIAALIFGVLSLIALLGIRANLHRGIYLLVFSAIIGLAACVIGISALRKARRTGTYRPRGAVGGIVLGALAALLSIPILATYLAFPTQVDNYVKCLSLAQTSSDQHACEKQFYRSIHLSAAAPHERQAARIA